MPHAKTTVKANKMSNAKCQTHILRKLTVSDYALLVGGSNGDGSWRGLVTIVELVDPRPHIFQVTVYVIYISDRLLTQANPNPRLPPPPDQRRMYGALPSGKLHERNPDLHMFAVGFVAGA